MIVDPNGWPAATVTEAHDEHGDIVWIVQARAGTDVPGMPAATHSNRHVLELLAASGIQLTDVAWVGFRG